MKTNFYFNQYFEEPNNDTKMIALFFPPSSYTGSHGVMVSTLESSDPSSNLGGTSLDFFLLDNKPIFYITISGYE